MRLIQKILPLVLVLAIAGCRRAEPVVDEHVFQRFHDGTNVVFVIDNHGGYSHAGRRIALKPDGRFVKTTYTDVIGRERTSMGTYVMDASRSRLVLSQIGFEDEVLVRADFEGVQYWVHEADREKVGQSNQAYFRQISLRLEQ